MGGKLVDDIATLHAFVGQARKKLDAADWDYLIGGTETEMTVRRNRQAIDSIALRPRVLNDVSSIDVRSSLLGRTTRLPVFLAPVGGLEAFDEGGARTVAKAAGRFGIPMMLSSVSKFSLEDVRTQTDHLAMYQLYVRGDDDWVDDQVERAMAAGYNAFCLTVDSALYSRRERDIDKKFQKPWRRNVDETAIHYQAALSWPTIARIKKKYDVPLILKGIATGEDTKIAIDHGVDVIYVSNHGGRQLDHGRGSLDVLPEVLKAAEGATPVFVDGGFARGTDILKAIALGAKGVGLGRLYCYALAAAGAPGIVRMLEILEDEITRALGLLGGSKLEEVSRAHLYFGAPLVGRVDVLGAIPLLNLDDQE